MTRARILALGAAFSAVCALPVWAASDDTIGEDLKGAAESTGHAIKKGAEATGHAIKEGAQKTGEFLGLTASEAARYASTERAHHRMTGRITDIDHDSGVVELKTAEAPLQLQFPPKAVRELNKGDEITVALGYAMADTGTVEKAYDAPKERAHKATELGNEQWVKGQVAEVNRATGILSVKTDNDRLLTLHFPPTDIANLSSGDHIAVEMGFKKGSYIETAPMEM